MRSQKENTSPVLKPPDVERKTRPGKIPELVSRNERLWTEESRGQAADAEPPWSWARSRRPLPILTSVAPLCSAASRDPIPLQAARRRESNDRSTYTKHLEPIIRRTLQCVTVHAVPCAGSLGGCLSAQQIDLRLIPLARDLLRNEGAAQALACRMSGWRPWRHDGYRISPAAGV
jgi:hypothetical protein